MGSEPVIEIARRLLETGTGVAFTGAGISTESGIRDFRSPGGVWTRYRPVYYDEFLASHEARLLHWRMKKEAYAEFLHARPNDGHKVLARWEEAGRIVGVITQNIDGLHQDAGSRNVLELHGTSRHVECIGCGKRWPSPVIFEQYMHRDEVPACDGCGGWLKTATVSFGQQLPEGVLQESYRLSAEAGVFLAIGSSLVVEPAASLPVHARRMGAFLAILNRDPTPLDELADVVIHDSIGPTLAAIAAAMSEATGTNLHHSESPDLE